MKPITMENYQQFTKKLCSCDQDDNGRQLDRWKMKKWVKEGASKFFRMVHVDDPSFCYEHQKRS